MMTLNFDEENKVKIHLPVLTQADQQGNDKLSTIGEERRNKGQVELTFYGDGYESTNVPSKEQKNALDYIQNNQEALLEAFYKYTKEVLYPTHIGFIGFDEVSFPEINKTDELRKTLGVCDIYIWKEYKGDNAYVAYRFDFTGDFEHGVILIAHKNRILGWEEDLVKDKVLADL